MVDKTHTRPKKLMRETSPKTSETGTLRRAMEGEQRTDKRAPPSFLLRGSKSATERTVAADRLASLSGCRAARLSGVLARGAIAASVASLPADLLVRCKELRVGSILVCGEEV